MDHFVANQSAGTGSAVVLEDCVMQKGRPAAAGSKILENFIAPFDAAAVERLRENNIAVAGRASVREFGLDGLAGDRSDQPSGAVKAVADGLAPLALCNDVFGTQRRQAAENGLCYIRPTYGTVSRYGLIPSVCSMDQIGVACRDLDEGFRLLSAVAGHDERDGAMFPEKRHAYAKTDGKITVGVPAEVFARADEESRACARDLAGTFGATDVKLPHFDACKQVMAILSCAEVGNNISRYDGVKFGARAARYKGLDDLYLNTRTECFGRETKLAAVMGAMVLSEEQYVPYYEKAMRVRRLIRDSLPLDGCDVFVLPASIGEDPYENLSLYALAPLAGLPSVSFCCRGRGVQLIANVKNENALLTVWEVCRR